MRSDPATFSSSRWAGEFYDPENDPLSTSIISIDPPQHARLRDVVSQAFAPRAVDAMCSRVAAFTDALLARPIAQGRLDVIQDLAVPLPLMVIAMMLGIPMSGIMLYKQWSDDVMATTRAGGSAALSSAARREMIAYFTQVIERRRRNPGGDLISSLLRADIDGRPLSKTELLGFCMLLLVTGNETSTALIGNAVLCFSEQPGLWARLRAAPYLIPQAIEEVLRYRSPLQSVFAQTTADASLGDQIIPAGAPVVAYIGSANRDEEQFPDAERFDIDRAPNKHLAFGHGIHYCLGGPLARLEARIVLTALVERFATMDLVPGASLQPLRSAIVFGVQSLPVTFTRA